MPAGYDKLNGICFEAVIGNIVCICIQITVLLMMVSIVNRAETVKSVRK